MGRSRGGDAIPAVDPVDPPARPRLRALASGVRLAIAHRLAGRQNDPAEAMELWRGLLAGRWSLVEQFERSGRRYLVAYRRRGRDARALAPRERQVVWSASLGHSNKLIAYDLGISPSAVAMALGRALAKLGVRSRAALILLVRGLTGGAP